MIYNNVESIAREKKLSIAELEKKAKLGNGTIGRWRNSSPTIDSLIKVANVLNVTVDALICSK